MKYAVLVVELDDLVPDHVVATLAATAAADLEERANRATRNARQFAGTGTVEDATVVVLEGDTAAGILDRGLPEPSFNL